MNRFAIVLSTLLLLAAWGCGGGAGEKEQAGAATQPEVEQAQQNPATEAAAPAETAPAPAEKPAPSRAPARTAAKPSVKAPAPAPERKIEAPSASRAAEPAPAPQPATLTVPAGTRFEVRLADSIDSSQNVSGDVFKAVLDRDLEVDGQIVAARGSTLTGKLENVQQSGRVEGRASLSMTLTGITVGNETYAIRTNTLSYEAESGKKKDATKIGAGAGIGAIVGAIAGGKKGAAIGAAIGGGAGTATVLATKGDAVKFSPEDKFSFLLRDGVEMKIQR